jgi:hypothetical protein
MPLPAAPRLDRNYQEILSEALARVPVHNPEWTNFNDSDPGVTLLQLFAFMTENLLYRSNQMPANARRTFLRLLGVPLRPASAAEGAITIQNERGPLQTITLPRGLSVQAGNIGFITRNALDVLPIEGRLYLRRRVRAADAAAQAQQIYQQVYGSYTEELEFYETVPVEPATADGLTTINLGDDSTVDHSLWLALLARPGDRRLVRQVRGELAGKTLTVGFMPYLDQRERELRPGGRPDAPTSPLTYHISTDQLDAGRTPRYERLDVRADANPLDELALVQISLPPRVTTWENLDPLEPGVGDFPPSLEDDEDVSPRVLAWIRIGMPVTAGNRTSALKARFSWAGVNAARVAQRIQVEAEPLGDATGEPDQVFTMANRPVITDTIRLFVAGDEWRQIDDLLTAPPEVPAETAGQAPAVSAETARVFVADRESGEVRMGNGLRGARPRGPVLASYAYGGGVAGNVNIGAIKTAPELPAGFKVHNPVATRGGTEGETVAEAERTVPAFIRHVGRAVTEQDFKEIVLRSPGAEVARAEILPLYHPDYGAPAAGVVTVMVVPGGGGTPSPDRAFLDAVCRHLDRARLVTTELFVHGPHYVPISVSVGIDVVAGRDIAPVREAVKAQVRQFLSPSVGGPEGTGWPLGKSVENRELWAAATRVESVASVRNLLMWDVDGTLIERLPLSGLQLPRLDRVLVSIGDPEDLTGVEVTEEPTKRLPVPVLPPEC